MPIVAVLKRGLQNGLFISLELAKVMIPVYIFIRVLDKTGALPLIAAWVAPLMSLVGLPGEASVLLVIGNTMNIYSVLGGIQAMDLTFKQINILALMLLISHGLFLESAVLRKTGSNPVLLTGLRMVASVASGVVINLVWK